MPYQVEGDDWLQITDNRRSRKNTSIFLQRTLFVEEFSSSSNDVFILWVGGKKRLFLSRSKYRLMGWKKKGSDFSPKRFIIDS